MSAITLAVCLVAIVVEAAVLDYFCLRLLRNSDRQSIIISGIWGKLTVLDSLREDVVELTAFLRERGK